MLWRLILGFLLALATDAAAQEALYGKQPPPGSSYVRLVNAGPAPVTVHTNFLPEMRLGVTSTDRVGLYTVVEDVAHRTLDVTAGNDGMTSGLTFNALPGGFVTVIVKPGLHGTDLVAVVDQSEFNQSRARLAFYNAAPECPTASLLLASGTAVLQDVMNGAAKSRTVNPVTAVLRASCGDEPGPSVALPGLEAGSSYSMWLLDPAAPAGLFLVKDAVAPYQALRSN